MKKISYFIILFLFLSLDSLAQEATPKPDPMQKIVMGQGKVSQKEYDEFWQYLEASGYKEKMAIVNSMRKTFLPIQEYQKESWACVKQAWNKRKKVPCPKADAVAAAYKKSSGLDFSAAIIDMSSSLIKAAATRKPVSLMSDVPSFSLTAESIAESEKFFVNSVDRLDQVLRPKYN